MLITNSFSLNVKCIRRDQLTKRRVKWIYQNDIIDIENNFSVPPGLVLGRVMKYFIF